MKEAGVRIGKDERGIALVLTLFLMLAMSVVGASMMFLSQTETYSSMNYRMMSQARYGAESGIQRTANYLFYNCAIAPGAGCFPLPTAAEITANYNTTVSPVTLVANNQPVVLSYDSTKSNYPTAAVATTFKNLFATPMSLGATNTAKVNFAPTATLMSMELIPAANALGGADQVLQTWQIVADGTITGGTRTATVEVSAVLDTQKYSSTSSALVNYGAFATGATCGAIKLSGGASTKSYDSTALVGGNPVVSNSGGNVGTNGNLTESGGATINGTLSTPRVGIGSCSAGNVTGESSSGGATVTGGIVQLPTSVTLPTPVITNPNTAAPGTVPTSNLNLVSNSTCATLGLPAGATCTGTTAGSAAGLTVDPHGVTVNWGSLSFGGGAKLTIDTGTYNINDVRVAGGGSLTISGHVDMTVINTVSLSGGGQLITQTSADQLALNVVDVGTASTPIDFSGGSVVNNTYDASLIQVQYAGTGTIQLSGGTKQAEVIYAPNAAASFSGGSALYGEVIASTVTDSGGATVYYDRSLATKGLFTTVKYFSGNPMLGTFTWSKY